MTAPLAAVDFGGAVTDGFRTLATFVPKLVGAVVILIVGYLIAKTVAKIIDKVLERVGFDRAVERGGVKQALAKSKYDASDIVAKVAFYFIFVAALSFAFSTLGIAALQQPINQLLVLLPKILVALIIFVIGAAVASAAKNFLGNILGGVSYGKAVANGVSILLLVLFAKAALDEVGVATTVTTAVLYTALAIIAGVTIVGVGGGLIKPMQVRWDATLNKAAVERENLRSQVQQRSSAYPADPQTAPTGAGSTPVYDQTATFNTPTA